MSYSFEKALLATWMSVAADEGCKILVEGGQFADDYVGTEVQLEYQGAKKVVRFSPEELQHQDANALVSKLADACRALKASCGVFVVAGKLWGNSRIQARP